MRGRLVRRLFVLASAVALIPACGDAGDGDSPPTTPPGAFTLSSPADQAAGQAVAPTLSWTASSDAAFYVLQISVDSTFIPVIFEQWGITTTSVIPTALLGHSEAYYWRVAAVNAVGSIVASNGPFRFDTVAPPGAVAAPTLAALVSPARRVPTFTWSGGSNATTWTLQIDESGQDFSTPVRQMAGLRASTARLDVALAAGTAYKARVVAGDGLTTAPSNEITFTTESAGVGALDTSLGGTGRIVSAFSGRANAVAVDDNGDIYLAGAVVGANFDMAVFKMRPDGSADPFFGSNGMATADFFGFNDEAMALILDGSKRPVVAGYATTGSLRGVFAMARFTVDGVLDTTFRTDGKTSFDGADNTNVGASNGNAIARGLAPWNTGYVIGGDDDNTTNVYFVRVEADGDADVTFGTSGISTLTAAGNARLSGLKAEGTTSVVGAGSVQSGSDVDIALFKVDSNGGGVAGFGTNGVKVEVLEASLDDQAQALVISGSEIVVAGFKAVVTVGNYEPLMARFQLTDGALVETTLLTHGGAGFVGFDSGNAIAGPTSGNHFIVAGLAGPSNGTNQNFGFFRVESDGDVDATFGTNGRHFDLGSAAGEQALAVVIDLEGRILAAGISGGRMALVRLFNAP